MHQLALATHEPVASSPQFFPQTTPYTEINCSQPFLPPQATVNMTKNSVEVNTHLSVFSGKHISILP